jgi:hypothetical protein
MRSIGRTSPLRSFLRALIFLQHLTAQFPIAHRRYGRCFFIFCLDDRIKGDRGNTYSNKPRQYRRAGDLLITGDQSDGAGTRQLLDWERNVGPHPPQTASCRRSEYELYYMAQLVYGTYQGSDASCRKTSILLAFRVCRVSVTKMLQLWLTTPTNICSKMRWSPTVLRKEQLHSTMQYYLFTVSRRPKCDSGSMGSVHHVRI